MTTAPNHDRNGLGAHDPRPRLTRNARRDQLLDAAAVLIVSEGIPALTMERLAVRAGVSKALPYSHFERSEDVLAELYRRETGALVRRVANAQPGIGSEWESF